MSAVYPCEGGQRATQPSPAQVSTSVPTFGCLPLPAFLFLVRTPNLLQEHGQRGRAGSTRAEADGLPYVPLPCRQKRPSRARINTAQTLMLPLLVDQGWHLADCPPAEKTVASCALRCGMATARLTLAQRPRWRTGTKNRAGVWASQPVATTPRSPILLFSIAQARAGATGGLDVCCFSRTNRRIGNTRGRVAARSPCRVCIPQLLSFFF